MSAPILFQATFEDRGASFLLFGEVTSRRPLECELYLGDRDGYPFAGSALREVAKAFKDEILPHAERAAKEAS